MFSARLPVFCLLAALSAGSLAAADTASVSGTVVNEATGAGLHMALVTISTTGDEPLDAAVYTDNKGAFSFDVPPGRYYLRAAENGYSTSWFGAPTSDVPPAVLTLQAGEVRQGIRFRLRPLGAISGTVVDQDNDPVPNARVRLLARAFLRGKQVYRSRNGSGTDDHGNFRLHGILPGRYYLLVSAPSRMSASIVRPEVSLADPSPDLIYADAIYPGVSTIAEATPLEVRSGSDIGNVVIRLNAQQAAMVSGTVELPDGVPVAGGVSVVFAAVDDFGPGTMMRFGTGTYDGNKFRSPRLAPGRYKAIVMVEGSQYRSTEEVDLRPGSQEITLHVAKPVPLAGHLSIEGGGDLSKTEISLSSPDRVAQRLNTAVKVDGSFEFPGVSPGIWDIGVHPVPKDGFIKSMMLGDQDVLTAEMVIGPQTSAPLRIVLSTRGAVVSGTVQQPADDSADLTGHPRAKILLAPSGRFSDVLSFFAVTVSDENGRFEFRGVTPGSYKLFAFDRMKALAWQDPAFMKRIDSFGKPVDIREGQHVAVDIDVKPLPPAVSEEP